MLTDFKWSWTRTLVYIQIKFKPSLPSPPSPPTWHGLVLNRSKTIPLVLLFIWNSNLFNINLLQILCLILYVKIYFSIYFLILHLILKKPEPGTNLEYLVAILTRNQRTKHNIFSQRSIPHFESRLWSRAL